MLNWVVPTENKGCRITGIVILEYSGCTWQMWTAWCFQARLNRPPKHGHHH